MINVLFVVCKCNCGQLIKFLLNLVFGFCGYLEEEMYPYIAMQINKMKILCPILYNIYILYTLAYQKNAVCTKEMLKSYTTAINCLLACKELHNYHQLSVGLQ
jgi:hypothetical protein